MASNTRASPVSPLGSRRSMACSTEPAAKASAASNWRCDDNGMGSGLAEVGGLAGNRAVGGENDLLDLHLGLGELEFAVALQIGAALVGRDRLVELDLAALQLLDDAFQLLQRVFERQRGDVFQQGGFFGHF